MQKKKQNTGSKRPSKSVLSHFPNTLTCKMSLYRLSFWFSILLARKQILEYFSNESNNFHFYMKKCKFNICKEVITPKFLVYGWDKRELEWSESWLRTIPRTNFSKKFCEGEVLYKVLIVWAILLTLPRYTDNIWQAGE